MTPPIHPADDILTPDERAVAARLAVLGGAHGPSPALDARILAAARASVAVPAAPAQVGRSPRRMRRWPGALGVAASLVIAVGLAWQLGSVFQLPPLLHHDVRVEAPAASAAASASASEDALSPDVLARAQSVPRAGVAPPADPARSPPPAARAEMRRSSPSIAERRAPVPGRAASARVEPPREFVDEALANAKVASAPAPMPAAAPAASAAMDAASAAAPEADRTTVTGSRLRQRSAPATAAGADAGADDSGLGVVAWIRHIRNLRDAGHPDAARASLQRFMAAHPGMRIPRDLQPLSPRD